MTSVCADLMQRDRVLDRGGRGSYPQMLFGYLGLVKHLVHIGRK